MAPECEGKTPREIVCVGAIRARCGPDLLSSETLADCGSPDLCALGEGELCALCEEGDYQCDGADLETCAADHMSWVVAEICDDASLCNDVMGECTDSVCRTGMHDCDGAILLGCNASEDGWVEVETCAEAELCDADNGRCNECVPGNVSCEDSTTLLTCRQDGTGYDESQCTLCTDPGSCCTRTVEECTDPCNGICESGEVCFDGACCTPEAETTTCSDATCGQTVQNNCGQDVSCSDCNGCACPSSQTCNASGCCADSREDTCSGQCGQQTNNCGETVDCGCCGNGECGNNEWCGTTSAGLKCCAQAEATACVGRTCGGTYPEGQCGLSVACNNCQHCSCPSGQVCNGQSCCSPESRDATCGGGGFIGAKCEEQTNNCGQAVNCGPCGDGLECAANKTCVQRACTNHGECGTATGAGPGWACCLGRCERKCRDYAGMYYCDNECKNGVFAEPGTCGTSPNCTTG